jgi:hypothetical protein
MGKEDRAQWAVGRMSVAKNRRELLKEAKDFEDRVVHHLKTEKFVKARHFANGEESFARYDAVYNYVKHMPDIEILYGNRVLYADAKLSHQQNHDALGTHALQLDAVKGYKRFQWYSERPVFIAFAHANSDDIGWNSVDNVHRKIKFSHPGVRSSTSPGFVVIDCDCYTWEHILETTPSVIHNPDFARMKI